MNITCESGADSANNAEIKITLQPLSKNEFVERRLITPCINSKCLCLLSIQATEPLLEFRKPISVSHAYLDDRSNSSWYIIIFQQKKTVSNRGNKKNEILYQVVLP